MPNTPIADTPSPPYYAAIFPSQLNEENTADYGDTAARMMKLAAAQPGFLGVETARTNELGLTVSYWESREAIAAWKANAEHQAAQTRGRAEWYADYRLRVTKVEREVAP